MSACQWLSDIGSNVLWAQTSLYSIRVWGKSCATERSGLRVWCINRESAQDMDTCTAAAFARVSRKELFCSLPFGQEFWNRVFFYIVYNLADCRVLYAESIMWGFIWRQMLGQWANYHKDSLWSWVGIQALCSESASNALALWSWLLTISYKQDTYTLLYTDKKLWTSNDCNSVRDQLSVF